MASAPGKLRDYYTTAASGSAGKEGKKKKKKRGNTANEKKKSTTEQQTKRGQPRTPSHYDDSEKPQTQEATSTETSSDQNHAKGHTKERSARKCHKVKTTQSAVEETSAPDEQDNTEASSQTQESLRNSHNDTIAPWRLLWSTLIFQLGDFVKLEATVPDIAAEEEFLRARLLQTEHHLAEQECSQGELKAKLHHKGEQASALQVRLRDEERRFLEELKRRSHKITALSRDLRKQTDIAAQLTFQLHSARFRLYNQADEEDKEEEEKGEKDEK
ncbi:coiled-coil domain-containing protein 92-like, partial [Clarias magur]